MAEHEGASSDSSSTQEAAQPLLGDLESQRLWGNAPSLDAVEGEVSESCDVSRLLSQQQAGVLRYVQAKGCSKLGEFQEEDGIVFPAFENSQLLTFGSDRRRIDWEGEWRRQLRKIGGGRPQKGSGWANKIGVEAYVVTIRDAAAPERCGLLQPLLKRYQARRCSSAVFALPAVQAVIQFKWARFARRLLMLELCWFLVWLVSFNTFVIAFQDEDLSLSLRQLLASSRGRLTVAAELLALVGMAPFLLLELGTLPAYGVGWVDMWNALDTSTYFIQIAITVMHLGRWWTKSEWLTTALAAQCILLVFRLQWFTQAFQSIRFAFLPIIKEVWDSLRFFFIFMVLIMWGFACAFYIALRRDEDGPEEYSTIITSLLAMFEHQFGDVEMKPMWQSKSPKSATLLAVAYTFVQGTVVINLILGIVINSLDKIMEQQDYKMLLQRARVIDEIESTMPRWMQRRRPEWFPRYVHMLRINPDKLDRVEQDALWSLMGRDEPEVLQERGSTPLKEGHPRHLAGRDDTVDDEDDEDEEEQGKGHDKQGGSGSGDGKGKQGAEAGPAGGRGHEERLVGQVAALQRQLEEQGRLLRALADRLGVPQPSAA
ncbi:hypothetical protein ABPG75_003088 [Micractinium tetrahymenae]